MEKVYWVENFPKFNNHKAPQGGNRIEITLSGRKRGYGGMKLDPIVVEKR